jgi:hypothetical protein
MQTITGLALGLAAALVGPVAFGDDDMRTKRTTSTTPTDTAVAPAVPTTSSVVTTTVTRPTDDYYVHEGRREDERVRVRSGFGLNIFGAAGAKDSARLGVGGRLEFVTPFGLTLGGSYTQHFTSEATRTMVRPALGEVGWAFAVAHHVELRPMVGLGYAFATARSSNDTVNAEGQTTNAPSRVDGFDLAPGAKVSFVGRAFEVFTLPKYHFITGNNFLGVEMGAGARF